MKQCPACKTTYTDVTLRFCLADGAALTDLGDEPETVTRYNASAEETIAMQQGAGQMRVDIPQQTVPIVPHATYQPAAPAASSSSGGIFKVIVVIIGLGILGILAIAVGSFIYYNINRSDVPSTVANKDVKPANPSPTADNQKDLRDQIANLERMLNDPKRNNQPANSTDMPFTQKTTGRVNSPGDHFLALRTLPNSQAGTRIYKIPDGETVSIGECSNPSRLGDRTGRWCQARYKGLTGWVFDAWLDY